MLYIQVCTAYICIYRTIFHFHIHTYYNTLCIVRIVCIHLLYTIHTMHYGIHRPRIGTSGAGSPLAFWRKARAHGAWPLVSIRIQVPVLHGVAGTAA